MAGSGAEKPVMRTLQQVELQAYYEHFVRAVIVKDEQWRSVQTKLDSFLKLVLLCLKTSTTFELSVDE
jgi:hypothetical protein